MNRTLTIIIFISFAVSSNANQYLSNEDAISSSSNYFALDFRVKIYGAYLQPEGRPVEALGTLYWKGRERAYRIRFIPNPGFHVFSPRHQGKLPYNMYIREDRILYWRPKQATGYTDGTTASNLLTQEAFEITSNEVIRTSEGSNQMEITGSSNDYMMKHLFASLGVDYSVHVGRIGLTKLHDQLGSIVTEGSYGLSRTGTWALRGDSNDGLIRQADFTPGGGVSVSTSITTSGTLEFKDVKVARNGLVSRKSSRPARPGDFEFEVLAIYSYKGLPEDVIAIREEVANPKPNTQISSWPLQ